MRALVLILALLAAGKIGLHEYMQRTATREVVISAYKERAIAACQKEGVGRAMATKEQWGRPHSVSLAIGKSSLDVWVWQIDNAMWNARYRNPYLYVVADEAPGRVLCEYDIVNGAASLLRL